MASILDRYGIKEVADVTFYELGNDGKPKHPVLYLDTLKVSTIEQTAEEAEARGGKGNAALIAWDYGKDINVTLEDALFSAKSMAIMFGNGTVLDYNTTGKSFDENSNLLMKTLQFSYNAGESLATHWVGPKGSSIKMLNPKYYTADGKVLAVKNQEGKIVIDTTGTNAATLVDKEKYFCTFDIAIAGSVIDVSANSFPGTYYVTGDTYARSESSGADEFFQFIIPKAKVTSENTITLEAEGDPSVFNMNLKVLRPADGVMMKLVKYSIEETETGSNTSTAEIYHNHTLSGTGIDVPEASESTDL